MNKQAAAVYRRNELSQEIPRRIIEFYGKLSRVTAGEDVVAVFGSLSASQMVENSALLLPERVEYMEMGRLLPSFKTLELSIVDQVYLLPESGRYYLVLLDKVKNSTKLRIQAPGEQANAFYDLVKEYIYKNRKGISDVKVSLKCPNCGAALSGYQGEEIRCEYCDTVVIG